MIERVGPATVDTGPFPEGHTLTGHFNILRDFRSRVLGNTRHVFVYLPPDYPRVHARRYPVLYMQDGQNLFDPGLSFIRGQDWQLDETAQALIQAGEIEPLIIVGVDHAGVGRADEYTPTPAPRKRVAGRATDYGRLLITELKPWIDHRYRTRPDAASTGIGGSSLGGLVSLFLGFSRPDVFGKVAALSPSLWWDRRHLIGVARRGDEAPNLRIWLDCGTKEGYAALQNCRILKNVLVRRGWRLGKDLRYVEASGGEHTERDWGSRAGEMLRFLFPPL
jgi:predicted alpha/beta superfamily hydrolase